MNHPSRLGQYFWYGLAAVVAIVLVDQYTKWMIIESTLRIDGKMLPFTEWFFTRNHISYFVIDREKFNTIALAPFLNLVMVWNQGISFGMFDSNSPVVMMALIGISLLVSLGLFIWLALSHSKMHAFAVSLIVGGALGNVIDRVRFGAVADFLDFHWNDMHWPAFNVADSAIVLGAFILTVVIMGTSPHNSSTDV